MYIRINDDNEIISIIQVGSPVEGEEGWHEVKDIPDEIIQHIFSYKYIDGEFVLKDNAADERLKRIKSVKITDLSKICNSLIEHGIDYNGSHYSLTINDQINLSKLESLARAGSTVKWHGDNEKCRIFTSEEIIGLSTAAFDFIDRQITYFNLLKDDIKNMTSIDEVVNAYYGMELSADNKTEFEAMTAESPFDIPVVEDNTDYSFIINDIDISGLALENPEAEEGV